jgi:hypothetical protein
LFVTTASHCAHPPVGPPGEPSAAALQALPERLRLHEVREGSLAVDLDDGDRRSVGGLELRVAADVDALEVAGADLVDDLERSLAEVTPLRGEQNDLRDRGPA